MMRLTTVAKEQQLWDYMWQVAAERGATGIVVQYFSVNAIETPMISYIVRAQVII
jgi:hypothetical protein